MSAEITIKLSEPVLSELEFLVETHRTHGAVTPCEDVAELISYVMGCIADGSRRPGSWERQLLEMMGIVGASPWLEHYRSQYGKPFGLQEVSEDELEKELDDDEDQTP